MKADDVDTPLPCAPCDILLWYSIIGNSRCGHVLGIAHPLINALSFYGWWAGLKPARVEATQYRPGLWKGPLAMLTNYQSGVPVHNRSGLCTMMVTFCPSYLFRPVTRPLTTLLSTVALASCNSTVIFIHFDGATRFIKPLNRTPLLTNPCQ